MKDKLSMLVRHGGDTSPGGGGGGGGIGGKSGGGASGGGRGEGKPTRPSAEAVRSWSRSLDLLLADKRERSFFSVFLAWSVPSLKCSLPRAFIVQGVTCSERAFLRVFLAQSVSSSEHSLFQSASC